MPSLRSRLLNMFLRREMKAKPLHLMPHTALTEGVERLAPSSPPKGVSLSEVPGGPVKGEWHRADDAAADRNILYLHGGGYYFGSPKGFRPFTFGLAKQARANVFSLDYRLASEGPFPAALDDAVTAYRWMLDGGVDPGRLVVGGDSAGGGLTLSLVLKLRDKGLPLPKCLFLFSPWTDLACTGKSLDENEETDVMFTKPVMIEGAKKYVGDGDPKNPFISPLYGDFNGFPPCLTFVSNSEILRDDSLRLHDRMIESGVKSRVIAENGLAHEWPTFYGRIPEAKEAMNKTVEFILDHWRGRVGEQAG